MAFLFEAKKQVVAGALLDCSHGKAVWTTIYDANNVALSALP
jgi:hypothetical protein